MALVRVVCDHSQAVVLATEQVIESARGVGVEAGAVVAAAALGGDCVGYGTACGVPGYHGDVGATVKDDCGDGGHTGSW